MKTRELIGNDLDWAVAKAAGLIDLDVKLGFMLTKVVVLDDGVPFDMRSGKWYSPSTNWAQGGPILELAGIDTINAKNVGHDHNWMAAWPVRFGSRSDYYRGETKLIAGLRCYVASKLGEEINLPKELTL